MLRMNTQKKSSGNIIALLTDFGTKDNFTGIMKGIISCINPDAKMIDLTHNILPQDIFEGAFSLFQSYKYFPQNTVFLCVVDPGVGSSRKGIIVVTSKYRFVGPDNGLLSLAAKESMNCSIYEISNSKYMLENISNTFHARDIFAPVAAYLSKGISPELIGNRIKNMIELSIPQINYTGSHIEGKVIHMDKFGNLITNIQNSFSDNIKRIRVKSTSIKRINSSYSQGEPGKAIALKGSTGFIEIAVNSGNAKEKLNVDKGETIIVDI